MKITAAPESKKGQTAKDELADLLMAIGTAKTELAQKKSEVDAQEMERRELAELNEHLGDKVKAGKEAVNHTSDKLKEVTEKVGWAEEDLASIKERQVRAREEYAELWEESDKKIAEYAKDSQEIVEKYTKKQEKIESNIEALTKTHEGILTQISAGKITIEKQTTKYHELDEAVKYMSQVRAKFDAEITEKTKELDVLNGRVKKSAKSFKDSTAELAKIKVEIKNFSLAHEAADEDLSVKIEERDAVRREILRAQDTIAMLDVREARIMKAYAAAGVVYK